jgi:hypothetical protein
MKVEPAPCVCGKQVAVIPQEGGRGTGELTVYLVNCECGIQERDLGYRDGTRRAATRDWNRIVKQRRAAQGE